MHEAWFADEDGVRKTVGLLERPVVQFSKAKEVSYKKLKILGLKILFFVVSTLDDVEHTAWTSSSPLF